MDDLEAWIAKAVVLQQNLEIQDRRYRLKNYKQCFVGSAATYVIISLKYANTADDAVKFGNKLIELNIIRHVSKKKPFKNEDLFYEFVPGYNLPKVQFNADSSLFKMSQRLSLATSNTDEEETKDIEKKTPNDENEDNKDDMKVSHQQHGSQSDLIQRRKSKLSGHEHDALKLFDFIINGSLFYYWWNEHLFRDGTQKTLIFYLENYMNDVRETEDFNLNYFQQLFTDKIKQMEQNREIFINIQQISPLSAELVSYFFDINNKQFKGKLFFKGIFALRDDFKYQFIEIPEIMQLNATQIILIKDKKYFGDILFKKFEVRNEKQESFTFYIKVHRMQDKDTFHIYLYLKSKPENYGKVKIIWDFVCAELQFQNIGKSVELERNKCDEIEGFSASSTAKFGDQLTFIANIRVVS